MYKEAIARDPNFALAIAQLAICRLRRHWLTDPLSEAELMEAGRLAKQALTLAPDLTEAHVALGLFYYYGFREYEPALTEFRRAIELQPNNSLALGFVAFVHRRQGKWDRTLEELKRSIDLNPQRSVWEARGDCMPPRMWKEAKTPPGVPHNRPARGHGGGRCAEFSQPHRGTHRNLAATATFPPDDLASRTGMFDMVIGYRGQPCLGRDFNAALKQGGPDGREDQQMATICCQSWDSCPGRRCYRCPRRCRESSRPVGEETARTAK